MGHQLVSAAAAVIHDGQGRVLLVRQNFGQQRWGLPGGRIAAGETPVHAVVRDVRLETGLETEVVDLIGLYHLIGGNHGLPEQLTYAFRCTVVGGEASVNAPGRIREVGWHPANGLPRPTTATAPVAIADAVAGRSGVVADVIRDQT